MAQPLGPPSIRQGAAGPPAGEQVEALRDIGIDQRLGEQVPASLEFTDETGRAVKLGDYFGKRPMVLALVYYECPMLCTQVLNGATGAMKALSMSVGKDFDVLTVSFDPTERPALAAEKKAAYLERYGRDGAAPGWHFLTGTEQEIVALTRAVGFRYAYNAEIDQYAHASAIFVLTPDGRLSRYLYGIEYAPRDLKLALVEASAGTIGNAVDQILLYCFHYDPSKGRYSLAVVRLMRVAGGATVLGIVGLIVTMRRRERQEAAAGRRSD